MQTNDLYPIELLVFDRNTWNHLILCRQMSANNLFKNKFTNKQIAYKLFKYI